MQWVYTDPATIAYSGNCYNSADTMVDSGVCYLKADGRGFNSGGLVYTGSYCYTGGFYDSSSGLCYGQATGKVYVYTDSSTFGYMASYTCYGSGATQYAESGNCYEPTTGRTFFYTGSSNYGYTESGSTCHATVETGFINSDSNCYAQATGFRWDSSTYTYVGDCVDSGQKLDNVCYHDDGLRFLYDSGLSDQYPGSCYGESALVFAD
jgi:hypothetical protein